MTYALPPCDFYDDGLVHAHEWSRATPPGGHHAEASRSVTGGRLAHAFEESATHDARRSRQ